MVGMKLSAKAQLKIDVIVTARRKFERLHSLVEQYAGMKKGDDAMMSPISHTATEVGRIFMNNGYGIRPVSLAAANAKRLRHADPNTSSERFS